MIVTSTLKNARMKRLHDPKRTRRSAALLVIALTGIWPAASLAEEDNPVVESLTLGGGAVTFTRPDYRGSKDYSTLALPSPYVDYYSRKLELTREGLLVKLLDRDNLHLRISGSGTYPGDDTQDGVREGMPELLPTFGLGPSLDWDIATTDDVEWKLRLPVRAVVASDFSRFDFIGWETSPNLYVRRESSFGDYELSTAATLGPVFVTGKHHRYYYEVKPQFATPTRPAYNVSGGYSGTHLGLSTGLKKGKWFLGISAGYDFLDGATFDDSPLVETRHSFTVGVALFYKFWKWERREKQ